MRKSKIDLGPLCFGNSFELIERYVAGLEWLISYVFGNSSSLEVQQMQRPTSHFSTYAAKSFQVGRRQPSPRDGPAMNVFDVNVLRAIDIIHSEGRCDMSLLGNKRSAANHCLG